MSTKTLERCFFCSAEWGRCRCRFGISFKHEGVDITEPNVSPCGRFFVDPQEFYGEAFTKEALAVGRVMADPGVVNNIEALCGAIRAGELPEERPGRYVVLG